MCEIIEIKNDLYILNVGTCTCEPLIQEKYKMYGWKVEVVFLI